MPEVNCLYSQTREMLKLGRRARGHSVMLIRIVVHLITCISGHTAALLQSVIGLKFSRHFFNQSEVIPKPVVARSSTFSRALCRLRVITSSFDWFTGLSPSFLIGQSNYFGFGLTTLD